LTRTSPDFNADPKMDWVTPHIKLWERFIPKTAKKILEIGNWEGRSTLWFHDHCKDAVIYSVDPILQNNRDRLLNNVGSLSRINLIQSFSYRFIGNHIGDFFDFIYIDGSHEAKDVLLDGLMAWKVLSPGGRMIFDDYGLTVPLGYHTKPPRIGIDHFLEVIEPKVLHKGYQVIVEKNNENNSTK
jgi:predicted O-methyltransferase YrrM